MILLIGYYWIVGCSLVGSFKLALLLYKNGKIAQRWSLLSKHVAQRGFVDVTNLKNSSINSVFYNCIR